MKIATIKIYLRNGWAFTFRPTDPVHKPPHESEVAGMMATNDISVVRNAAPTIVIRWAEVVAVEIGEEDIVESAGAYA